MPVEYVYQNQSPEVGISSVTASRLVFRFYTQDPQNNNAQININLGVTSAVFTIYPPNALPVVLPLAKQANADFVLSTVPANIPLANGFYPYQITLDNDYVPFVSGAMSYGDLTLPDQIIGVLNASRNAMKVNASIIENPQIADSASVTWGVTQAGGVATVTATAQAATKINVNGVQYNNPNFADSTTNSLSVSTIAGVPTIKVDRINPPFVVKRALLKVTKPLGTAGGDFIQNVWTTRILNSIQSNDGIALTLDPVTGYITLPIGTFTISGGFVGHQCQWHKARVFNVTDNSPILNVDGVQITGITVDSGSSGSNVATHAHIDGAFTVQTSKTYSIQHQCNNTRLVDGLGLDYPIGSENVNGWIWIEQVA